MRYRELPADYALVLQQIGEDGGDSIDDLVDMVRVNPNRLQHVVHALHHKGLIRIQGFGFRAWLSVSTKGRRYLHAIWPEGYGQGDRG